MRILVNRVHYPVTALGFGRRLGIWLQGCSIRCAGCVSTDTWRPDPGSEIDAVHLLDHAQEITGGNLDGVTISGGEPFDQPASLRDLLLALTEWRNRLDRPIDLLCYSGYSRDDLFERHPDIVGLLDVLIPEPFLAHRPTDDPLCGSANQPVMLLTDLAAERYAGRDTAPRRMQVHVAGSQIWMIGIPKLGDLERLQARVADAGVVLQGVSWMP